ncbi:spore germination protein [Ornithinibacillus sp. BX22]|uniref:Spore germination protein n=2 Tax=Ornithinibacillus TaxID=484508 RepID=A0A923L628_9BACI|nr:MULTISPECIES: spore germination protein [Ornithinibacillus]MBC5637119.1 spore germination protein [Ornithinibacillus hominis]MBS3679670.1 spore germination protein [Ornithinibacillus massiliensis]
MKERVGVGTSFDVGFREITVLKTEIQLYYVTGLIDSMIIQDLIEELLHLNETERERRKIAEIVKNRLLHQQVSEIKTMDEVVDQVLSGLIVVLMNGERFGYAIDVRNYPGRSPEEPDTERVIRGSRDGFTENIIENTALTRRRIRDERLRNEMLKVGERSKTDVCLSYIKDIADDGLVDLIRKKIEKIDIDGITMAEKSLEEYIVERRWNPYPLVRFTERPDVAANHLLEGHVIIIVDTSPSVIIVPTTFFHHSQHAEEHRQAPLIGSCIRWLRFLAIFLSIFLVPTWLLFVLDPTLLPGELSFIGPNEDGNIPIVIQLILGVIGIEFLRMAAIHTPTALSTAMGLIAAVLIGQIAIDVGLLGPEVILYISLSAIGSYVTPSYELSVANKVATVVLLLVTAIFGLYGYVIGTTLFILFLASLRSMRTPYLWPLLPFNPKAMLTTILRFPTPFANTRPSIVHPKNIYRQPVDK